MKQLQGTMGETLGVMAVGHLGGIEHGLDIGRPRAHLAERLGVSPASLRKQYSYASDGNARHTGYIAGGQWWTLYVVSAWHGQE